MAYSFSLTKGFAMERMLSSHRVTGLNEKIRIEVLDSPGPGGACHKYRVSLDEETCVYSQVLEFQNGPIQEVGVNGISVEALLAIVEDRLIGFQSGQFSCQENGFALSYIQDALRWLGKRTGITKWETETRGGHSVHGVGATDPNFKPGHTKPSWNGWITTKTDSIKFQAFWQEDGSFNADGSESEFDLMPVRSR
jgi:hypothetical protein